MSGFNRIRNRSRRAPVPAVSCFAESLEPRRLLANEFDAGINARSIVTADFNNDSKPDVVVVNTGLATGRILLGQGDGTLGTATSINVGQASWDMVAGDFNNDGFVDLATANALANKVSFLRGNGNGTFQTAVTFNVGLTPQGLVAGDFNKDSKLDLAVTNSDGNSVSILLANGTVASPSFASAVTVALAANTYPLGIAAGDFNNDSNLDLAVANNDTANVSILTGSAAGTFTLGTDFGVSDAPVDVIAGDFVDNGNIDLIVVREDGNVTSGDGVGNGTFNFAATYGVGTVLESPAAGDFNGDGKADLAFALAAAPGRAQIYYGSGNLFALFAGNTVSINNVALDITAADFNGDGKVDLATANATVSVRLGFGDSTFTDGLFAAASAVSGPATPSSVATGDFNSDGIVDIVASNKTNSGQMYVRTGTGSGTFNNAITLNTGITPNSVIAVDLNRDGNLDLVTADQAANGTMTVRLGNGNGSFVTGVTYPVGPSPGQVATGDFNGDGNPDIVVSSPSSSTLTVYVGNGTGTMIFVITLNVGSNPLGLTTADFNGDGRSDIATANESSGTVSVWRIDSVSGWIATQTGAGFSPTGLASGDFNADGRMDLVVSNDRVAGTMVLLTGNGTATFGFGGAFTAGANPRSLVAGDFNNDGRLDVLAGDNSSSRVTPLLANGTGGFGAFPPVTVGTLPVSVAAGDFNGDGRLDLVTANSGGGNESVALNVVPATQSIVSMSGGVATVPTASGAVAITRTGDTITFVAGGVLQRINASGLLTLTLASGVTATAVSDIGRAAGRSVNLTVDAGASITANTSQHLAMLSVFGPFKFTASGGKVLRINDFNLGGQVDLNDNDMVLDYASSLDSVAVANVLRTAIFNGRAAGAWSGNGFISSAAKNNASHTTTLGYLSSVDYQAIYGATAKFDNEPLDATSLVVRYTLYGDTDLDRTVGITDFNRLATNFGANSGKFWLSGDFDYDAGVGITDFNLLAVNFGKTMAVPDTATLKSAALKSAAYKATNVVDLTAQPRKTKPNAGR